MRRAGLARARTPRRRRVRPPGDHGQACAAGRRGRRRRAGHDAASDGAVRRHRRRGRRERRRRRPRPRCSGRRRGACTTSGSVRAPARPRGSPTTSSGSTTRRRSRRARRPLVLRYHVLWELDPRLLRAPRAPALARRRVRARRTCITCSDEGRLGEVVDERRPERTRRCAPRAASRTVDTTLVVAARARRPRARPRRHGHRRVESTSMSCRPRGPTSSTRSSRATSATRVRCSPISLASAQAKVERQPRCCGRRRSRRSRRRSTRSPRTMAATVRGGRTAVHVRQRRQLHRRGVARGAVRAARPRAGPLPPRCLADDTAVLTALGNDVGFDLVFSRQLIAHARPGDIALGVSTSGELAQPARSRSPRLAPGAAHARPGRLRRRRDGRRRRRRPLPGRATRTACTASRRRRRRSASRSVASRCRHASWHRASMADAAPARSRSGGARPHRGVPAPPAPPERRRRHARPRRRRQGVGRARRRGVPRRVRQRRARPAARRRDVDARRRASGSRSAPTRSWCKPLRVPGRLDRPPRGARHRERPRRAGRRAPRGCRRRSCIEEGFPVAELRAIVADMAEAARAGRRRDRHRRHQGGGPGRGRRPVRHHRRASASIPPGRDARSRAACSPATSCSCRAPSPTTAWR